MTVKEALNRCDNMEQYDYCYCASAKDFEAIHSLVDALRSIEEKCVHTITMREDMPYSEVHAILDLIREEE